MSSDDDGSDYGGPKLRGGFKATKRGSKRKHKSRKATAKKARRKAAKRKAAKRRK